MPETAIPADYVDGSAPALDDTRLNAWATRTNTNSAFRLAAGTPGGAALLGADGTLAEAYRWEGSSGGGGTSLDVFVDYMTKANGAAPSVADTGQAFTDTRIGAGSALATIVSGRCIEAATGTAPAANYRTIQLSDHSQIRYLTGEWEMSTGSSAGQVATLLMWESAWTAGLVSVLSNRSTAHIVGSTTGYLVQTADTASPSVVTTYYSVVYPVAPGTGVQTMQVALDEATDTLTVTGYDGTSRDHGPQAAFTAFPCTYAQHEIYLTNPSTDGAVKFRNFGADSVVGDTSTGSTSNDAATYLPAPTGIAATDTAALQAAIDALPSIGGKIIAQSGAYAMNALLTLSKVITLEGRAAGVDPSLGGTVLYWNSATAQGLDFTVDGCHVKGIYMSNNFAGTQTSGFGVRMTAGVQATFEDSTLYNFYDNVRVEGGTYQKLDGLYIISPFHDGIVLNNSTSGDAGDTLIHGCFLDTRSALRNPSGAAIRWQTGSGPRITNCKINATGSYKFPTGIDCAFANTTVDTADLFIDGLSIENVTGTAIKLVRASGTHFAISNQIHHVELQNVGTGIQLGPGFEDTQIDNIVIYGATTGIDIIPGAGRFDIGENVRCTGVTTPIAIAAGLAATNFTSTVRLPRRENDGVLITDATPGSASMPVIRYDHERFIDGTTISGTASAIWTMLLPIFCAGNIDLAFTGSHSGVGGFAIRKLIDYSVDGAGVVTLTDYGGPERPSANPKPNITFDVATANKLVVKLATSDGAALSVAKGHIKIDGSPTQFKVGA